MAKMLDLTNTRVGRLLITGSFIRVNGRIKRECKCDCGNICFVTTDRLMNHQKSCGCLSAEEAKIRNTIHGQCRRGGATSEYTIWASLKARCNNNISKAYKFYGGRGIKVCDRWMASFENFIADMGIRPSVQHSIDRYPNANGNYEPSNCRWATKTEQARNRRSNKFIEIDGVSKCIAEWCELYNITQQVYYKRRKRGWSISESLETPLMSNQYV